MNKNIGNAKRKTDIKSLKKFIEDNFQSIYSVKAASGYNKGYLYALLNFDMITIKEYDILNKYTNDRLEKLGEIDYPF